MGRLLQVGDAHSGRRAGIALARLVLADLAVLAHDPAIRTRPRLDGLLEQRQPLHQGLRARRAAGHVNVHRQELVHPLHHAVDVEHTPGIGAGAHGNDPLRLQQLIVEVLHHGGHLAKHGASDDDQVRLSRRRPNHFRAKARHVVAGGERGGHFHVAAGEAEVERPQGMCPPPSDEVVQLGGEEALGHLLLVDRFRRFHRLIDLRLDQTPFHLKQPPLGPRPPAHQPRSGHASAGA